MFHICMYGKTDLGFGCLLIKSHTLSLPPVKNEFQSAGKDLETLKKQMVLNRFDLCLLKFKKCDLVVVVIMLIRRATKSCEVMKCEPVFGCLPKIS